MPSDAWPLKSENKSLESPEEEKLLQKYSDLVNKIAGVVESKLPSNIEKEDLVAVGMEGLHQAIKRYDPSRNTSFETYASFRIRGSMLDFLRSEDPLSRHGRKYEKSGGIDPLKFISLEEVLKNKSHKEFPDKGGNDPFINASNKERAEKILNLIEELSSEEKRVLDLYYYKNLTLKEIGNILNFNEAKIFKTRNKALKKLRKKLNNLGNFRDKVYARREKIKPYGKFAFRRGRKSKEANTVAIEEMRNFEKKYGDKIRPQIEKLTRISGLTEKELRDLFKKILYGYSALIYRGRASNQAMKNSGVSTSISDEINQDLPLLLFDFSVVVKRVKAYSFKNKIARSNKELILKIMEKYNPYILDRIFRDPIIATEYSKSEIRTAVLRHKDGIKFLYDSIVILDKLYKDPTIAAVYSKSEIKTAVLNHENAENFLRKSIVILDKLYKDPTIAAAHSNYKIRTAVLEYEDAEDLLYKLIPSIKKDGKNLKNTNIGTEAPKTIKEESSILK